MCCIPYYSKLKSDKRSKKHSLAHLRINTTKDKQSATSAALNVGVKWASPRSVHITWNLLHEWNESGHIWETFTKPAHLCAKYSRNYCLRILPPSTTTQLNSNAWTLLVIKQQNMCVQMQSNVWNQGCAKTAPATDQLGAQTIRMAPCLRLWPLNKCWKLLLILVSCQYISS